MDEKLIRLLIGWSFLAILFLLVSIPLRNCISNLLALLRSKNEPFQPVECEVVKYTEENESYYRYYLSVKRLDGVISDLLTPCNYGFNDEETIKKYVGCHMTFYAKASAPRHLFCKEDSTSQEAVKKEINSNVFGIIFILLIILLFIWMMIYTFHYIY